MRSLSRVAGGECFQHTMGSQSSMSRRYHDGLWVNVNLQ
jgi:hypothetical protein